jgi:cytochrome c oxidase accessory protein FixG
VSEFLYEAQRKLYPREIKGRFQRLRYLALFWLLGMFYLFPWLNYGERQMVLFDLPARKFYLFNHVLWPQDFVFLAAFLVLCALTLFFVTALAGRLWCGFACPQTVWTEVFLWVERRIEGDRNVRMRRDQGPPSTDRKLRRLSKHAAWGLLAFWTGVTFIGFFTPIRPLMARFPIEWHALEWFWCLFYGGATYLNAGLLREQVCKYMCPYARFQSAMLDHDSLVISYDEGRGEPRGKASKASRELPVATKVLGDCIDCKACVQVCPTGIDIRDGLQYECIGCAACIDACDEIMDKISRPRGLVRYTTANALAGKPTRILRPRVLIYAALLLSITGAATFGFFTRSPLHADLIRDRGALYRYADGGQIENAMQLKLMNKRESEVRLGWRVLSPAGIQLQGLAEARLGSGEVINVPLRLRAPEGLLKGGVDVELEVVDLDRPGVSQVERTRFFGPES